MKYNLPTHFIPKLRNSHVGKECHIQIFDKNYNLNLSGRVINDATSQNQAIFRQYILSNFYSILYFLSNSI